MLANVIQLAAGILLGISSFIKKDLFQVPVFGEKLPGTLENAKQKWVIRLGLLLLILGYTLPILGLDLILLNDFPNSIKILLSFVITGFLVGMCYFIANNLAKSEYKKAPVFTKETPVSNGAIAFEVLEEVEENK